MAKWIYSLILALAFLQVYARKKDDWFSGDAFSKPLLAGATATTKMLHIAITNYQGEQNVTWLKPISDEEFAEANKQ